VCMDTGGILPVVEVPESVGFLFSLSQRDGSAQVRERNKYVFVFGATYHGSVCPLGML
jgi:hypothetical protein